MAVRTTDPQRLVECLTDLASSANSPSTTNTAAALADELEAAMQAGERTA